jgi:hypothetical protein
MRFDPENRTSLSKNSRLRLVDFILNESNSFIDANESIIFDRAWE